MKLKRVSRLDSIPLTAAYFTSEGFLMDRPIVTTCGIFEYENEDGSIHRELRLPEHVFEPDSLKSYKGKPIIVTHDAGEITKSNVGKESIGTMLSEGLRDGNNVRAEIVIHDTDTLKFGLRELSLGYDCELDETPGVWRGKPYDAVQHNIRINHLALVEEARAGHNARLNLDGKTKGGNRNMKQKINFDGMSGALTPEQLEEAVAMYLAANPGITQDAETEEDPIQAIRDRADRRDADMDTANAEEMQQDIKTLIAELDRINGANDMQTDEADPVVEEELPKADETDPEEGTKTDEDDVEEPTKATETKMDSADMESKWMEMYSICQVANKLGLGDTFSPRNAIDGKKRIIQAVNPKLKLDGKSKGYIDGAYEIAVQQALSRKNVADNMRKMIGTKNQNRMDAANNSGAEAARNKMVSRLTKRGEE